MREVMAMSKFNVGDSVRIRTDLMPGVVVDHLYCNTAMASWGGDLDTIKSVTKNGLGEVYYSLDHHCCYWNDAMLEPAGLPKNRLEKLTIISNGTLTWAAHRLPDGSVKKSRVLREQGMERDFERDAERAAREAGVKIEAKGAGKYCVDIDIGKLYDAVRTCITVKEKEGKSNG